MTIKSVCVFCGSRSGNDPAYMHDAEVLGTGLADAGLRLVYGAGDVGLMGSVARAAQAAGGETFGVIPRHLVEWEVGKTDLTTYVVTETMHERKKVMFMNCDAVVVLPGGAGSLDELFEVLTWRQLGLHAKPVIIVNTNGYWDKLIGLLQHVVASGFAGDDILDFFQTVPDAKAALRASGRRFGTLGPCHSGGRKLRRHDFFDFVHRMVGQRLGDFTDHLVGHFLMHFAAQFAQGLGRRHDHQRLECALMGLFIKNVGQFGGEAVLGQLMPVGVVNCGAMHTGAVIETAASVCRLFPVRRIFLLFLTKHVQIGVFTIRDVFQKQRFFTVGDQHPGAI